MLFFCIFWITDEIVLKQEIPFSIPAAASYIVTPRDMTADGDGNVYLLDVGAKGVFCWNAEGVFVARFGSEGGGPGEFSFNNGVGSMTCFDNRIIIFDESVGKLHFWDRHTRKYLESVPVPDKLGRLPAFGSVDNRLVVINAFQKQRDVVVLSPDFKEYRTLASTESQVYVRTETGWDFYPYANIPLISFGAEHVYMAEANHNWVKKLDLTGRVVAIHEVPIVPDDLSQEERDFVKTKVPWMGEGDHLHFPKKRHFFLQIAALAGDTLLLLTHFDEERGILKGLVLDFTKGSITGRIDRDFDNEIGFFGPAGGHLYLVRNDENDDYQLHRYKLVPTSK